MYRSWLAIVPVMVSQSFGQVIIHVPTDAPTIQIAIQQAEPGVRAGFARCSRSISLPHGEEDPRARPNRVRTTPRLGPWRECYRAADLTSATTTLGCYARIG